MGDDLDGRYMRLALRLARKGEGRTSPNPMVGVVVVRGGNIIATGYHQRAGKDHAEIVALRRAGERARGATLVLNLEPCSHEGRTPPCTRSVIRSGVKRVVVGMVDPNPLVSGRGILRLKRAGIQVHVGLLEAECRRLNESFIKYITRRIPFVILKLAASLDGKIATSTGDSRWVTGVASRNYVHRLRNQVDAVLIGVGTALADNPRLTCRLPHGRDPWRIILDGHLRIPLTARLLRQREPEKTIVFTGSRSPIKKVKAIRGYGAQVWTFPLHDGKISFASILKKLGKMGLVSVMIEGGATTASRALRKKVVDKVLFIYAPKIIGGEGKNMIEALGITRISQSRKVKDVEVKRLGNDLVVSGYL
ncbi:MAG: bifunctional diaminohydroxyphosphoribosylaminopyrimidine deaminase/5-amino-6-(5-phosphoribosylamino)uracil reductase RibD [Deltaproteobacteria bacterium]|nr:bifunctional diaminohydroxyphosphoribosylaminopyrimidine deaminase/5-amino-6-(5-phosphoribosylamino)uracil reductase RibD [Deltaproteobacteria bacterium]